MSRAREEWGLFVVAALLGLVLGVCLSLLFAGCEQRSVSGFVSMEPDSAHWHDVSGYSVPYAWTWTPPEGLQTANVFHRQRVWMKSGVFARDVQGSYSIAFRAGLPPDWLSGAPVVTTLHTAKVESLIIFAARCSLQAAPGFPPDTLAGRLIVAFHPLSDTTRSYADTATFRLARDR